VAEEFEHPEEAILDHHRKREPGVEALRNRLGAAHEVRRDRYVREPQRLSFRPHLAGKPFAFGQTARARGGGEGGTKMSRATPQLLTAQDVLVVRERPQNAHVPAQGFAHSLEYARGGLAQIGRLGHDLEEVPRERVVALQFDALPHIAQRPQHQAVFVGTIDDADRQLDVHLRAVGEKCRENEGNAEQAPAPRSDEAGKRTSVCVAQTFGNDRPQRLPDQLVPAPPEQVLGCFVGVKDRVVETRHDDRVRERVEHGAEVQDEVRFGPIRGRVGRPSPGGN
jgi:hypothetical protein